MIAFADSGASLTSLKRQYRWKSDAVAHSYIDQSKYHKLYVSNSLALQNHYENNNIAKENQEQDCVGRFCRLLDCEHK